MLAAHYARLYPSTPRNLVTLGSYARVSREPWLFEGSCLAPDVEFARHAALQAYVQQLVTDPNDAVAARVQQADFHAVQNLSVGPFSGYNQFTAAIRLLNDRTEEEVC